MTAFAPSPGRFGDFVAHALLRAASPLLATQVGARLRLCCVGFFPACEDFDAPSWGSLSGQCRLLPEAVGQVFNLRPIFNRPTEIFQ